MKATRSFKNELCCWKFENGKRPQIRTAIWREWGESIFESLEEFLADPEKVPEVRADEAEGVKSIADWYATVSGMT